jgi:O-antigen ligase
MLLFASFYSTKLLTDPFITAKHIFAMLAGCITLFAGIAYFVAKKYKLTYTLNLIDLALLAYLVYILLHESLSGNLLTHNIPLLNVLMCGAIYFLFLPVFKSSGKSANVSSFLNTLIGIIIAIAIFQALYGFLEYFNMIKKLQQEFPIGGAFGNPGPYTNFLTALLPVTLYSAVFFKKGFHKYGGMVASILILAILPFTQARTSWIAAAIALAFVGFYIPVIQKAMARFVRNKITKLLSFSFLAIIVIGVFIALLSFKKESATGRLFVWKVSTELIKDKPLFGFGYGKYAPVHNQYQAIYFEANPNDTENGYLADCVNFAFNEYIQIASEVGLVGLLLFLIIFALSLRSFIKMEATLYIKIGMGIVLTTLVSSLFSYPLQSPPSFLLLLIGVMLISSNNNSTIISFVSTPYSRKIIGISGLIVCTVWFSISVTRYKAEKDWLKAFQMVRKGEYAQAKVEYARLADKMNYNPFFLFNYGAELTVMGEYKKSIEVLTSVEDRLSDADFYLYLGSDYEALGDTGKALECFEKAMNMMPIKFLPIYKVVIINEQNGNHDIAITYAKKIMQMPVKVKSKFVDQIRTEMEQYLSAKGME